MLAAPNRSHGATTPDDAQTKLAVGESLPGPIAAAQRGHARARGLPGWYVRVEEHVVGGRWHVEPQVLTIYATTARDARAQAVRHLHSGLGVSPWRPLLRCSYCRTSATPIAEPAQTAGRR